MTIEEVMHKAVVYARKVRDGNDENCWEYDELRAALTALVAQARDEERQESNLLRVEVERLTKIAAWNQDNVNALLGTTRDEEAEEIIQLLTVPVGADDFRNWCSCKAAIRARIAGRKV